MKTPSIYRRGSFKSI